MAFQIFYIFINVSVIAAPLISGTLGQKVGWHYGFGCAGVVMVLGLFIYLSGQRWLPADLDVATRPSNKLIGRVIAGAVGIGALVVIWLLISGFLFSSWLVGTISASCWSEPLFLPHAQARPRRQACVPALSSSSRCWRSRS